MKTRCRKLNRQIYNKLTRQREIIGEHREKVEGGQKCDGGGKIEEDIFISKRSKYEIYRERQILNPRKEYSGARGEIEKLKPEITDSGLISVFFSRNKYH